MPWFKIDDSSHSHPKFIRAGNAALGLWLRCGAYSAQHLLEGRVPKAIVRAYGTRAQVRKLVESELWHGVGHECPRCPQPDDGDYVMHDFFEGGRNSSRAQVEASRKGAAERQAKARARGADVKRNANRARNESIRDANGAQNAPTFSGSTPGQNGSSQRDAMEGVTPSHAMPTKSLHAGRAGEALAAVQIPDWAQPLIDSLARRGISVSWSRLGTMQWAAIQELINTRGVDALTTIAASRWNPRDPIKFASLLLRIWLEHPAPSPTARDSPHGGRQMPPHCGDPDCDPVTRTREIEDCDGLKVSTRCHRCHPEHSRKDPAA